MTGIILLQIVAWTLLDNGWKLLGWTVEMTSTVYFLVLVNLHLKWRNNLDKEFGPKRKP